MHIFILLQFKHYQALRKLAQQVIIDAMKWAENSYYSFDDRSGDKARV